MVTELIPPATEASLAKTFSNRLMLAFRFNAPCLLAVKRAARMPAGKLAMYSRLYEQFRQLFSQEYFQDSCTNVKFTPSYVYDTPEFPCLVSSQR